MTHDFFTKLVIETRDTLRRYVRKMVRSEESAEEIVQEAFLRTYERVDALHTPQAFLFSTARNLVTDKFRRERNVAENPLVEIDNIGASEVQAGLDELFLAEEFSRILRHAVELLRRLGVSKAGEIKPFEALLHVKVTHGVPVITDIVAVRKQGD